MYTTQNDDDVMLVFFCWYYNIQEVKKAQMVTIYQIYLLFSFFIDLCVC